MNKPTPRGRRFWRSLEERLDASEFRAMLHRDFPDQAAAWLDPVTRRRFLALLGASLSLAGLTGCGAYRPHEAIVPYVRQPENLVPGRPQYYATAMPLAGTAIGLLVESHEGRPTKIEGNPGHPASLGATDVLSQASVLGLYDPDRSQTPIHNGDIRSWAEAQEELRRQFRKLLYMDPDAAAKKKTTGRGLRILTEAVASPTLAAQLNKLMTDFPEARWYEYEPARLDPDVEGARIAFGQALQVRYEFSPADAIVSLDADFLSCGGGQLKYTRDFADRRRIAAGLDPEKMNRLYAIESSPTATGAVADHRLRLQAAEVEGFARVLAAQLGVQGTLPEISDVMTKPSEGLDRSKWAKVVADDLQAHAGRSIVVAGPGQPPAVHALAYAINDKLGNNGTTVLFSEPPPSKARQGVAALHELAAELDRGDVECLLILGGNPAYTAPADLQLASRIGKAKLAVHLGQHQDETAAKAHWHIPEAHYLESWGDARAYDGTVSIIQPLIAPLYGGQSAIEALSALADESPRTGYEAVRGYWKERLKPDDFDGFWITALNDGIITGTQADAVRPKLKPDWAKQLKTPPAAPEPNTYEIIFRLDPTIFDGRFANNGWLQELPKPLSRLTWDNAALVSQKTAGDLKIDPREGPRGGAHGETLTRMVEISFADGRRIKAPLFVLPGHPDGSITLHLGHGRTRGGRVACPPEGAVGVNAYSVWTSAAPFFESGATVRALDERYTLACVQLHHTMDAAGLLTNTFKTGDRAFAAIRSDTRREYEEKLKTGEYWKDRMQGLLPEDDKVSDEELARRGQPRRELRLIDLPPFADQGWGMAIDLGACVGCGACVVACQAENNSPVVGKEEVTHGREMHWLRIDRYYEGHDDDHLSRAYFQPVPCMQCETAPCEQVCPVGATVHSPDGLNDMVYNRCVGTRYCSNNCPYKVRRFNFLAFADFVTPSLKLLRNPDVTVRSRGVMEKCTYCVQRIREAEIDAQNSGLEWPDGKLQTACQQACPARAIVYGRIDDKNSKVSKLKESPLNYGLMAELNTRPRTTYLAAIRNPNPAL
jgi:molybdopterin-containing oxidoreductase family iron-sulfur binding subunit